ADADQILVMSKGSIIERGTHRELLAASGAYAQMWELQQQEEQTRQGVNNMTQKPDAIPTPG
ncbi:MAG: hypothetical protein ABI659_04345, partial [Nitrosospira sp.]